MGENGEMMMDWQPIETAPKDGTWLLLCGGSIVYGWDGRDEPPVVAGQWTNPLKDGTWQFAWYDGGYNGEYESPTHWRPMLEVPQTAST